MKNCAAAGPIAAATLVACLLPGSTLEAAVGTGATTRPPADATYVAPVNAWLREQAPAAKAWDLGGQFRVRYELKEHAGSYPNGDFLTGLQNSNDYVLFRTRVHLGWNPDDWDWISVYAEGRDSQVVGDTRPITETDTFDLYQAWVRVGDPKSFPVTAKIGRQELLYGDERYVGVADWSNVGRTFDAAKLRFENESIWVDAFTGRVVIPRDDHFNTSNDYDWLTGVYASTRALAPWQDTEAFVFIRDTAKGSPTAITSSLGGPGPRDIVTFGTRWKSVPGRFGPWDYVFEAAGQLGSIQLGGRRQDQESLAVNVTGGHTWKETFGTPRWNFGYDFGSGDSNPNDDVNETFDPLYGTNHRLYGLMDVFGLRNLHIPRTGLSFRPAKDLTISLEWLGFWLVETADYLYPEAGPARVLNGAGRHPDFSNYVGQELDLLAVWRTTAWCQMQAGYSHFFVGEYLEQTAAVTSRQAEDATWVYAQILFQF